MRYRGPHYGPPGPGGYWSFWTLLLVLALIGLGILLFMQMRKNGSPVFSRLRPGSPAGEPPDAAGILKMRYARGEIGRDEYLRIGSDLGVGSAAPAEEPTSAGDRSEESKK